MRDSHGLSDLLGAILTQTLSNQDRQSFVNLSLDIAGWCTVASVENPQDWARTAAPQQTVTGARPNVTVINVVSVQNNVVVHVIGGNDWSESDSKSTRLTWIDDTFADAFRDGSVWLE